MIWLAHSTRKGREAQSYHDHVLGVVRKAGINVGKLLPFVTTKNNEMYLNIVESAASYHDLGKLSILNQEVLRGHEVSKTLPIEHRDAGIKHLLGVSLEQPASTLIYAHHRPGLPNLSQEKTRETPFRFPGAMQDTEQFLAKYLRLHGQLTKGLKEMAVQDSAARLSAMEYRMLLSCLVDADYSDTAGMDSPTFELRWSSRLDKLDSYVENLRKSVAVPNSERNRLRDELYTCCKSRPLDGPLEFCDSPVGTGKTTAIMARALNVAEQRGLRRIMVVLPFTNIISQTVGVLRKALVLDGEDPLEIVAEHHHQADFERVDLRHLATTWTAPIVVTTAVQFFETLASNTAAKLRKLNQLPGSCVIIDESHAALPTSLMPAAWKWLTELANDWGCHVCLCSGTSYRFWENSEFKRIRAVKVTRVLNEELSHRLSDFEKRRVSLNAKGGKVPHFRGALELICYVQQFRGPRVIVLNTVRGAAYLAKQLRGSGRDVLHLSTALTPSDREKVIREVKRRLQSPSSYGEDWTLVATSCVECGMDFSFRNGFCELRSAQSYLQLGGRVNRNGEYEQSSLHCFTIVDDNFSSHSAFENSQNVFKKLIENEDWASTTITNLVSKSFDMECKQMGGLSDSINKADRLCNFVDVAEQFKVIAEDTVTVLVDGEIVDKLQSGIAVSNREIQRGSVTLRRSMLKELDVTESEPPYLTSDQYDDFLGYMKNV